MTTRTIKSADKTVSKSKTASLRTCQYDMGRADGYLWEESMEMPSPTSDFTVVEKGFTCKIDAGKVMAVRTMGTDGTMSWKKLFFPRGGTISGPTQVIDLGGISDAEMTAKAQHAQGSKCLNDSTSAVALYLITYTFTLLMVGIYELHVNGPRIDGGFTVAHVLFSMVFSLGLFMAGSYAFGRTKDVDLTETKSSQWLTKAPNET